MPVRVLVAGDELSITRLDADGLLPLLAAAADFKVQKDKVLVDAHPTKQLARSTLATGLDLPRLSAVARSPLLLASGEVVRGTTNQPASTLTRRVSLRTSW